MGYSENLLNLVPLNTSSVSQAFQILDSYGFSVQAFFTGTICSFQAELEVSTDPYNGQFGFVPEHWDTMDGSVQVFSSAGSFTWDVQPSAVVWVRLKITDESSGTNNGTIGTNIYVKGPL